MILQVLQFNNFTLKQILNKSTNDYYIKIVEFLCVLLIACSVGFLITSRVSRFDNIILYFTTVLINKEWQFKHKCT
jgi:hypothetical protein